MVILLSVWGCGERAAQVQQPLDYRKAGVSFQYPPAKTPSWLAGIRETLNVRLNFPKGIWKVTQEMHELGIHYLFVESPGDAVMIVQAYPDDGDEDMKLKAFVKDFSGSAREDTPVGSFGPSTFDDVVREGRYESITERFSISLLGQSVPHIRVYKRAVVQNKVCILIAQVATEDLEKVQPGFELVFKSFKFQAPESQ